MFKIQLQDKIFSLKDTIHKVLRERWKDIVHSKRKGVMSDKGLEYMSDKGLEYRENYFSSAVKR